MLDQDDATDEEHQHETPIPEDVHLPDAQLPHGHRFRSQSRERLDQLYPQRVLIVGGECLTAIF